jgi:hypothetical protein
MSPTQVEERQIVIWGVVNLITLAYDDEFSSAIARARPNIHLRIVVGILLMWQG